MSSKEAGRGTEVRNQRWRGSLVTTRLKDEKLTASGWFWWLTEWKSCQNTQSPARLGCTNNCYQLDYMQVRRPIQVRRARRDAGFVVRPQKVWLTSCLGAVRWHRASTFPDTTQVLFYEMLHDQRLIDEVPP